MKTHAAIDIGSNAIRLMVGGVDHEGNLNSVYRKRTPVRLGADVFSKGRISGKTLKKAIAALEEYCEVIERKGAKSIRAVATSAVRNADNRDILLEEVAKKTGIDIEIIDSKEEAEHIHSAICHNLIDKPKRGLFIDIGGGSLEITLSLNGGVDRSVGLPLGTVRLLSQCKTTNEICKRVDQHRKDISKFFNNKLEFDSCIGTGGNIECFGDMRKLILEKRNNNHIRKKELAALIDIFTAMTTEQRRDNFDLRPDRADVILPASIAIYMVMDELGIKDLKIPRIGLREGVIWSLCQG